MTETSFHPDAQVAEMVEAYSLDAVDLAAQNFGEASGIEGEQRHMSKTIAPLVLLFATQPTDSPDA